MARTNVWVHFHYKISEQNINFSHFCLIRSRAVIPYGLDWTIPEAAEFSDS